MPILLLALIACGTAELPAETTAPEVAAPEAAAAEPAAPAPTAAEGELAVPEGYLPMTLLMPAETLGEGIAVGSAVDLVAGEGASEALIAKEVEVLAMAEEERGLKVTFALTPEHRSRLLGSELPGQPRAVLHQ